MKTGNKHIITVEEKVDKTLQLLDNIKKVEENPFFYTRLKERMEQQEKKRSFFVSGLLRSVPLRPVLLAFIVILNISSALYFLNTRNVHTGNGKTDLEAFAEEYSLSTTDYRSLFDI